MSSPTTPLPAERGPYTGPETGDFDASLEALAAVAGQRSPVLPPYAGPVTGELAVLRLEDDPDALAAFRAAARCR